MPKSKKKPTKKALKQKQKQSQQQIVNVNIGRALREAVRRRTRPLANPTIQQPSTIFRVNEPALPFFQPFSTQAAIKIPEPEPAQRVAFNIPVKVKEEVAEKVKMFNEPIRETPFTQYMPEKSLSDTEFEYEPQYNVPIRNVRENTPAVYGGVTREGRIIKKVDRIWTKAPDGRFILNEGVEVPEGKIFNENTGRFTSPFKKKSVPKKGAGGKSI
jgi:hypothetical protein